MTASTSRAAGALSGEAAAGGGNIACQRKLPWAAVVLSDESVDGICDAALLVGARDEVCNCFYLVDCISHGNADGGGL